jgi:two-component system, chemotaxis family, chemotaxis protein CheY
MDILIVDDTNSLCALLSDILENANHRVVGQASNGIEAIKIYKSLKPDIVTMDIIMPVMDGITALKEIIKYDSNAKIIMCSVLGQHAIILEAIKSGAKDFINKPFKEDRVIASINKIT